jgi:hypothetical protein
MRPVPGSDYNIGFYRMALRDTTLDDGAVSFGKGVSRADSMRVGVMDQYSREDCPDSNAVSDPLLQGATSGYFSVKP